MSFTNSTPNLHLPQYLASDVPSWLTDINNAFLAIDTGVQSSVTSAQVAVATAATVEAEAASATSLATVAEAKAVAASAAAVAADTNSALALAAATGINVLDNSFFPRPVNQREITGAFSTVNKYFIDRWKLISGSVTINANGIIVNGIISQILEYPLGEAGAASVGMFSGTATIEYNDAIKTVTISSSGGCVKWAKLEAGSIPSPYVYKGYAVELVECLRYYRVMKFTILQAASPFLRYFFDLTGMRTSNPTLVKTETDKSPNLTDVSYTVQDYFLWVNVYSTASGSVDIKAELSSDL